MKNVTIKDVARSAGVSIKTVSRVLNGEEHVRDAVRQKVLDVTEALQYVPHPSARSLGAGRSFTIGLILGNPHEFGYLKSVIEGVHQACESSNYTLLVRPSQLDVTAEDVHKFARLSRIEGMFLPAPMGDRLEITRTLTELSIPFAQLSPRTEHAEGVSVSPNDEEASYALAKHIHSFQHVRIGFIEGDPLHGASERRRAGFMRYVEEFNLDRDPSLIVPGTFDFESGRAGAQRLLQLEEPPTAIFACNDEMAAGAIAAANQLGLQIPHELSIVGFDDSPTATRTWPKLTTVRQPTFEMAEFATAMLIDTLAGTSMDELSYVYECEIVQRDSLAQPARVNS